MEHHHAIEEAWAQLPAPDFPNYAVGNEGPRTADELIREALRWWHAITPPFRPSTPQPGALGDPRRAA